MKIPGLGGEVFFGDPSRGPVAWRDAPEAVDDDDQDEITDDQRRELVGILGFDPREEVQLRPARRKSRRESTGRQ